MPLNHPWQPYEAFAVVRNRWLALVAVKPSHFSFFLICAQAYVSLCFSLMYDTESEEKHLDFITTNQQMVSLFFYFISVISLTPEQFFANKFCGGQ